MDSNAPSPSIEYLAQNRWDEFFFAPLVSFIVAMIMVAFRFASAWMGKRKLGHEDWTASVAALCAISNFGIICSWKDMGFGRHIQIALMIDPNVFEHFFKTLMAAEILYVLLITFSKLSVIALLWRIFYLTTMRWPLIALLVINGGWVIATILCSIFSCIPIRAFWDITVAEKTCIDSYEFFIAASFLNMLTDFALTILPIPYAWVLQMPKRQKALVALTLAFGGFTSVVCLVRLVHIIGHFPLAADPTWNTVTLMRWTFIEQYCAIIATTLPTLGPLSQWIFGRLIDSAESPTPLHSITRKFSLDINASWNHNYLSEDRVMHSSDSERQLDFVATPQNPQSFSLNSLNTPTPNG